MNLFKSKSTFSKIKFINTVISYYLARIEKNRNPFVQKYCQLSLSGAHYILEDSLTNSAEYNNQMIKYKNQITEEKIKDVFKIIFIFYFLSLIKDRNEDFKISLLNDIKSVFNFDQDDMNNFDYIKLIFPNNEEENKTFTLKYYGLILDQFSKDEKINPLGALYFRGLLSSTFVGLLESLKDEIILMNAQ
jgi:hypothetical protein